MIVMIETGISNLSSVEIAFRHVGTSLQVTSNKDDIANAEAIILPGVGAFGKCMASLRNNDLVGLIRNRVLNHNVPIMGICLGMQLLATSSEEYGFNEGLGLLPAHVKKLSPTEPGFLVPNIGWYDVIPKRDSILFPDNIGCQSFYHVHSYYMDCEDTDDAIATIDYSGEAITVAVERGNIFGVQFHPEKSQDAGLDLIERFLDWVRNQGQMNTTSDRKALENS